MFTEPIHTEVQPIPAAITIQNFSLVEALFFLSAIWQAEWSITKNQNVGPQDVFYSQDSPVNIRQIIERIIPAPTRNWRQDIQTLQSVPPPALALGLAAPPPTVVPAVNIIPEGYSPLYIDKRIYIIQGNRPGLNQHQVIIVFRGTSWPGDVINDIRFGQDPFNFEGIFLGRVHSGFLASWNERALTVMTIVRNLFERIHGLELFVTGHSLGAAIATLCAAALKSILPRLTLKVYTFASPRVGSIEFFENYSRLELPRCTFRVLRENDDIPNFPPGHFPHRPLATLWWLVSGSFTRPNFKHVGLKIVLRPTLLYTASIRYPITVSPTGARHHIFWGYFDPLVNVLNDAISNPPPTLSRAGGGEARRPQSPLGAAGGGIQRAIPLDLTFGRGNCSELLFGPLNFCPPYMLLQNRTLLLAVPELQDERPPPLPFLRIR